MLKRFKWNKKKIISLSIVSIVIISVAIGVFAVTKSNASKSTGTSAQRTAKVTRGNIAVSITGSGTVESSSTSDVMANVDGKITKAYFKEGDKVKKGDLLYEIDDTDARLNIQKIQNSISQADLNVKSTDKSYSNLVIKAPFSGKVSNATAEVGDNVNNGMSLFTITDTSKLTLSVPFSTTDAAKIKVGQKTQVHVQELMDTLQGTVTAIDDAPYIGTKGGYVKNVQITVYNPGSLTDSMTARVDISTTSGTKSSNEICKFEYANKKTVRALTQGTLSAVNISDNQYVQKDQVLIQIENDDLQVTSQTNELKIEDLQNQLTAAQKALENYKIYSTIDGTVSSVSAVAGDSVKAGSALISIRDFNQMQFTIPVDELDISKVQVGQDVSITVDALTGTATNPLSGKVVYKAMEGTSSNGVATYNVTIKINETKNLLAGMNANATIILQKSENTLLVPLEAVTQMRGRAFVWVKKTSTDNSNSQASGNSNWQQNSGRRNSTSGNANGYGNSNNGYRSRNSSSSGQRNKMPAGFTQNMQYYSNATMKQIEIGLTSDQYVEIKSGLSEGDEVILPPLVSASNGQSGNQSSNGGFNINGLAGRMSGGGMFGGERTNNNYGGSSNNKTSSSNGGSGNNGSSSNNGGSGSNGTSGSNGGSGGNGTSSGNRQ